MALNLKKMQFLPEKTRLVYSHLPAVIFSSSANAIILAVILWDQISQVMISGWLAFILGLTLLRQLSYFAYRRSRNSERTCLRWMYLFFASLFLSGLGWGAAGIFLFAEQSVPHQIFVAFVLGGMVAGSIASTSVLKGGFYLFSLPALLPITIRFFLVPDEIHLGMGVMSLVFLGCCMFIAGNIHASTVNLLRLRHENEQEIERRRQSEKALIQYKDELESIVAERTADLERINEELRLEILERQKAEQALFESREQFRSMVENIPEVVYRCEVDFPWHTEYINEKAADLTGYAVDDFQRGVITWGTVIHPEDLGLVNEKVRQGVEKHSPYQMTYRIIHKGGSVRWVQERGQAIYDQQGQPHFLDGAIEDITEKRLIEEELNKTKNLEALGVLAGGLAHDFNNLLMAVFGNVELAIHQMGKTGKGHSNLVKAVSALDKSRHLTRQLLTFARGGSLAKEIVHLPELIKDVAGFILSGTSIRTEFQFPPDLWTIEINRGQMEQVLQNLLLNCKDFMTDGGVVSITAENVHVAADNRGVKAGNYVRIVLADDGPGIPEEILDKIFNPYFSTKGRGSGKGTGLGLAICHSIVSKNKGHIAVQNGPEVGAIFTLLLPAFEKKEENGAARHVENGKASGGKRILVMEDETEVALVTGQMLQALGYDAKLVANGEQAVSCYEENLRQGIPYDLVILDLTIRGGMGGEETIRRLLRIDPKVKAVVASGYAEDPILANYEAYGFCAAIAKPYTLQALQEIMQTHC